MSERYPYLAEYTKYLVTDMMSARHTVRIYTYGVRKFYDWLLNNHKFNSVRLIKREHIRQYRDYLQSARYRLRSVEILMRGLKSFLRFCVDFQYIEDSPFPVYINLRGRNALPHLVPTPQEIFRIRMRSKVRLVSATLFEVMLSSGMREGELMQTYASDVHYNDRPFDMELKRPSPYFIASIAIKQQTHATKNSMPRKVYLSYMAVMLLKRYLEASSIPLDGRVPLFPWSDSYIQDMIRDLGKGIVERNSGDLISSGNSGPQRERGYTELDVNDLKVSDEFKRLIERRQEEENSIEPYKRQSSQPIHQRKRQLHPHALRHAFTNYCYYRTPLGTRQDEHNLRILMGHSGPTSTLTYLKTLPLVSDDQVWNRLWMGKPEDWHGINR